MFTFQVLFRTEVEMAFASNQAMSSPATLMRPANGGPARKLGDVRPLRILAGAAGPRPNRVGQSLWPDSQTGRISLPVISEILSGASTPG